MCESITLTLPRTKCENVRVLFSRIRLLFGVSVEPAPDAVYSEQGPPGQGNVMAVGNISSENSKLMLTMIEGGHEQLNKAKDYLLAACSETAFKCERRCQYAPDIFQRLVPMRDEVERESSAMVRFEGSDNVVVISGHERNVLTAIRFLDAKARDVVVAKSKNKPTDFAGGELGPAALSQIGTQSREVFRQGRNLESEDSSYDSDYEITEPAGTPQESPGFVGESYDLHHDDVSRTVSDTLAAEFAEYVTQDPNAAAETAVGLRELDTILADPNYTSRVEFALKLGYTETQVQIALQKLGAQPSQNELLAELIKLGAASTNISGKGSERLGSHHIEELTESEVVSDSSRSEVADDSSSLRHIVIDGSNVAMSHGNKACFSCRGIKICVDWFRARGHQNITVFVPRWRKEVSRPDAPIKDQEILAQLEKEGLLVFTPSRHIGGRRMVCYDDRYVLRLAVDSDGIVVSNDNYRDLVNESPEFKKIVEDRLLMYSFVNDRFMPPDDPLGRHGPSLDNFLRKSTAAIRTGDTLPPPCPYGKKCTYGNKCKYHHPERGNQPQKSVTERLAEQAKIPLQEVKSRGLKSRESSPGEKLKSTPSTISSSAKLKKQPLSRTKSLVPSSHLESTFEKPNTVERTKSDGSSVKCEELTARGEKPLFQPIGASCYPPGGYPWQPTMPQISLTSESPQLHHPSATGNWATLSAALPPNITGSCAEMFLEPDAGGHLFVAKRLSDPDSKPAMKPYPKQTSQTPEANLHRKLQRQLTLNPAYDPRLVQLGGYVERQMLSPQQEAYLQSHDPSLLPRASSQENLHLLQRGFNTPVSHQPLNRTLHVWDSSEHQTVTRNASAPDSYNQWPPSARMQHLNSTSDTRLNMYPETQVRMLTLQRHWMDPPRMLWQEQPVRPSSVPPPGMRAASPDFADSARYRLYFHLASIFPKQQVQAVMDLYPQETNPQKICAAILNMFPKG